MQQIDKAEINGLTVRKVKGGVRIARVGNFKASNPSGLGNALKKAGFSQSQVKEVYSFLRA